VSVEDVVQWATAGGARVLGLPHIGTLAPGQQADIAVFTLDEPRHFGMHDPMIAPVTCAGSANLRYLLIGGRIVVENGAIPGLDIQKLKSDAIRVVTRLAA
jgi:cytosine/adenosine deaminase-related metal-dependent hydrolase